MPRRRRYPTITSRDINNLQKISPSSWLILLSIVIGGIIFVVGVCLIISFTSWLNKNFELPSGFTFNFPIFAILALIVLSLASIVGLSIAFITNYNKAIEEKYRGIQLANVDSMTGIEFEQYLQRILSNKGYRVSMTNVSGDLGVDLVASGNNEKFAIQVKRYSNKVSRRAVSDAVAGMQYYGCTKAMVITNNYFSSGAIKLAQSTGCILIDREKLALWINEYQNTNSQITRPRRNTQKE
jgi:HJR/Mrr/RecB family endonuclease